MMTIILIESSVLARTTSEERFQKEEVTFLCSTPFDFIAFNILCFSMAGGRKV
jgi:hypothetical protein